MEDWNLKKKSKIVNKREIRENWNLKKKVQRSI